MAMLKSLVILILLAVVTIGTACLTPSQCPSLPHCPLPTNEFDPSQLLSQLHQESQPFAHFYDDKIAPLGYTIRWFHNPDLPLGTYARTCVNEDHNVTIELGNIMPGNDSAYTVAHELASVVIDSEGYKSLVIEQTQCATTGDNLNEMIWTPLRDSMLAGYSFNVTNEYYTFWLPPLLSAGCGDGNDTIIQLQNACAYVQLVLYWRDVLSNHNIPSDVDNRFQQCFPNSWARGKDILAIINEAGGYDTPAKVSAIFQTVLQEYKDELGGCICVP